MDLMQKLGILGAGMMVSGIVGFVTVLGNLVCGLAPNFEVFLLGRLISGSGAAMVLVSGQIILADITTPERRGRTMAIYQGVFLFAVGFGPLPGGLPQCFAGENWSDSFVSAIE